MNDRDERTATQGEVLANSPLHDAAHEDIHPEAPTDFETAREAVEAGDAEGIGIVITRHDGMVVVEITDALDNPDTSASEVAEAPRRIFDSLGWTYTDVDPGNILRAHYQREAPIGVENEPVLFRLNGDEQSFIVRVRNRGWFPVFGRPLVDDNIEGGAPGINEIDPVAARKLVRMGRQAGEDPS
jgi:hypothetical protein